MEENLITKKELLELTGISYGSLYRWKRKNLIPDDWFIRRSTFTGQETFFPRDRIIERIEQIQQLKDGMSLDEIAETFSPVLLEASLSAHEVVRVSVASQMVLEIYVAESNNSGPYNYNQLLELYLLSRLLKSGELGREDALSAVKMAKENLALAADGGLKLVVVRKVGMAVSVLAEESGRLCFEGDAKRIFELPIGVLMADLKQLINRGE